MPVERQKLPERNNFYAYFKDVSKTQVREALENNGWHSRSSSWYDLELTKDWSELILDGDEVEPLLNGAVVFDKESLQLNDKAFNSVGGHYVYEFYDDNKNLLFERKSSN